MVLKLTSMAIKHGCVASTDLTGVIENNDLGVERSGLLGRVVFGVRADLPESQGHPEH